MNLLSHYSLILLSLLLLPISAQSTVSTNLTAPSNTAMFECLPLRVFNLRLGLVHNCAAAILALPQIAQPKIFHYAGLDDISRLPVSKNHGDCMVTVDLIGSSVASTWTSIGLVASLLMTACTDVTLNRAYTGGYASPGNDWGIKVYLQRYEGGVGMAGNSSGLLSE